MEIARNYSQRSHPLSRMLTGSMCTVPTQLSTHSVETEITDLKKKRMAEEKRARDI